MNKQEFIQNYEGKSFGNYSADMVERVKRCFVSNEEHEQAVQSASEMTRISMSQAIEDVKDFFACLKCCYSGYDFFLGDEKCDEICNRIIKKLKLSPVRKISNKRLNKLLYCSLKTLVADNHFSLYANGMEYQFTKKYIAYVTDVVVKSCENSYVVIKGNEAFPCGYQFKKHEIEEYLMPTLYLDELHKGEDKYYLLGKYTTEYTKKITILGKSISTHRILSDLAKQECEERLIEKKKSVVINHKSYGGNPWDYELLNEYFQDGKTCSKKDVVILNLLNNGGGSSNYPEQFYRGLANIETGGFIGAYLPMPEQLKEGTKCYNLYKGEKEGKMINTFQGKLIVLMNKGTASSAEMAVSPAFYFQNAILVGSATWGCSSFGECVFYQLPNSHILFRNGHKLFWHERFEEGRGFLPDYWIDDENPIAVVQKILEEGFDELLFEKNRRTI